MNGAVNAVSGFGKRNAYLVQVRPEIVKINVSLVWAISRRNVEMGNTYRRRAFSVSSRSAQTHRAFSSRVGLPGFHHTRADIASTAPGVPNAPAPRAEARACRNLRCVAKSARVVSFRKSSTKTSGIAESGTRQRPFLNVTPGSRLRINVNARSKSTQRCVSGRVSSFPGEPLPNGWFA